MPFILYYLWLLLVLEAHCWLFATFVCLFCCLLFGLVLFFGCTHSMWNFLGQWLNLSHSCNLHHSCDQYHSWVSPLSFNPGPGVNLNLHSNLRHCSRILNPLYHSRNSWLLILIQQSYWNVTVFNSFSVCSLWFLSKLPNFLEIMTI